MDLSSELLPVLARRLGGAHAYVFSASNEQELLRGLAISETPVESLGGSPVCVNPIRMLAREAHGRQQRLVCDNSQPTFALCAPCAQGADISFEALANADGKNTGLYVVAVAAGVELDPSGALLVHDAQLAQAKQLIEPLEAQMRAASDVAQVVASYLAAHPRVQDVVYPGLKRDHSFALAATTLHNGFGPLIDWRSFDTARWQRIDTRGHTSHDVIGKLECQLSI